MNHKKKILKLVELAIEINETTEHVIFVDLSGHTKGISLYGRIGGWREGSDFDFYHTFYWDWEYGEVLDKEYEFLENLKTVDTAKKNNTTTNKIKNSR